MRRSPGYSLLELLIATAVLSLLLLAASAFHVQALDAGAASTAAAERGQIAELAAELLGYHLGLAGHRGVSGSTAQLGGPALALARNSGADGTDALTVRYLEERWHEDPVVKVLRFDVKHDSRGRWNLYQQEEGATRQPAVQRVSGLHVTGLLGADGSLLSPAAPLPAETLALELRLEFDWGGTRDLVIPFGGPTTVAEEAAR